MAKFKVKTEQVVSATGVTLELTVYEARYLARLLGNGNSEAFDDIVRPLGKGSRQDFDYNSDLDIPYILFDVLDNAVMEINNINIDKELS